MTPDFPRFPGAASIFPTRRHGLVKAHSEFFSGAIDGDLVVEFGSPHNFEAPLVRIHSECVFAEVLGSRLCDCHDQLDLVFERFKIEGHGILYYLRIDGRGAGLSAKVKATDLEVHGIDTYASRVQIGVPPESRSFRGIGEHLRTSGFNKVRLLSNNPEKIADVEAAGIEVVSEPLLIMSENPEIRALYNTKARRFGHLIPEEYYLSSPEVFSQLALDFSSLENEK